MINCKTCGAEIAANAKVCPKCGAKNRKPVYTKWWFWALIVVVLFGAIGGSGNQDARTNDKPATQPSSNATLNNTDTTKGNLPEDITPATPEPTATPEPDIWTKGGTYKVGADIDAGEYIVVATSWNCYIEVDKDSSGTFDSIVSNDNTATRAYYTLLDGQYFKVQGGKFARAEAVAPYEPEDGVYSEGMYLVGKDIPAGEYKITAIEANCYLEVDKDSYNTFNSIITNDNISLGESTYITIKDGQYLKIQGGQISQ